MAVVNDLRRQQSPLDQECYSLREARFDVDRFNESEVYVDLDFAKTISSEDLNDLIRLYGKARHQGRLLVLENVSDQLLEVFEMTRLDRLFELQGTA